MQLRPIAMPSDSPLRFSTLADEGPYQASKWLTSQVLLDTDEMAALVASFEGLRIFAGSGIVAIGEGEVSIAAFLEAYSQYVARLKQGLIPEESIWNKRFYDMWTLSSDLVYSIKFDDERQLVKPNRPVVQLQAHQLGYSSVDGQFRPMVVGGSSIHWGIQFGYPQIFQYPFSGDIAKVDLSEAFPNTALFRHIQRWLRKHSIPTPFVKDGKKTNVPMRIGKSCLSWINKHPQLVEKGIKVGG